MIIDQTVRIELTCKRPQDAAPITVEPRGAGWTLAAAAAHVEAALDGSPVGTVYSIAVQIGTILAGTE